jgi:radical SAM protein with 4Fe4S-binding SPASM domain
MAENEPDLIFGNAAADPLEKVWREQPLLREIREGFPDRFGGICARCSLRRACGGHCMAQNYHDAHNLWAGFWYCEEALARGLFPTAYLDRDDLDGFIRDMDRLLSLPEAP